MSEVEGFGGPQTSFGSVEQRQTKTIVLAVDSTKEEEAARVGCLRLAIGVELKLESIRGSGSIGWRKGASRSRVVEVAMYLLSRERWLFLE
jgi:hypothetical protein